MQAPACANHSGENDASQVRMALDHGIRGHTRYTRGARAVDARYTKRPIGWATCVAELPESRSITQPGGNMRHRRFLVRALALTTALAGTSAAQAAQAADTSRIDPDAIAALEKMGGYLRTLNAIQVRAVVTTEEVRLDGQKIQS